MELTFSSSIPAVVISMAVLSLFKTSNVLENNMVQTQASAAGTFISYFRYPRTFYVWILEQISTLANFYDMSLWGAFYHAIKKKDYDD
ncbi:hypothetical protein AJ935_01800 [Campylobacter sp. BCW_6876]|nr:hypothetical protein AJ935_01800 [Campylobacter sp. BCW_6876]